MEIVDGGKALKTWIPSLYCVNDFSGRNAAGIGLGLDALSLTRTPLSFNTANPPVNEREAAHYLDRLLHEVEFELSCREFFDKCSTL